MAKKASSDTERFDLAEEEQRPTAPLDEQTRQLVLRVDRRRAKWAVAAVALVATVAVVFGFRYVNFDFTPDVRNPFQREEIDRSGPVLLKQITDLARFEGASGTFQVVIDIEKDAKFIPAAIFGERILFVAMGTVDGYVDFTGLKEDAITVSEDKTAVRMRLPHAALEKVNLDNARTYVVARERGIVDRFLAFINNSPERQQRLYQLAEQKIGDAAKDSGLVERTEQNTRLMLDGMLRALGFTTVEVSFGEPTT